MFSLMLGKVRLRPAAPEGGVKPEWWLVPGNKGSVRLIEEELLVTVRNHSQQFSFNNPEF